MKMLFYNIYWLITKANGKNFNLIRLSTKYIFNDKTEIFINKKEAKIIEAKFKAKSQTILKTGISGDFNGCRMIIEAKSFMIMQKNQTKKLVFVDIKDNVKK